MLKVSAVAQVPNGRSDSRFAAGETLATVFANCRRRTRAWEVLIVDWPTVQHVQRAIDRTDSKSVRQEKCAIRRQRQRRRARL
jgi:hypothetical protein